MFSIDNLCSIVSVTRLHDTTILVSIMLRCMKANNWIVAIIWRIIYVSLRLAHAANSTLFAPSRIQLHFTEASVFIEDCMFNLNYSNYHGIISRFLCAHWMYFTTEARKIVNVCTTHTEKCGCNKRKCTWCLLIVASLVFRL